MQMGRLVLSRLKHKMQTPQLHLTQKLASMPLRITSMHGKAMRTGQPGTSRQPVHTPQTPQTHAHQILPEVSGMTAVCIVDNLLLVMHCSSDSIIKSMHVRATGPPGHPQ